MGQWCSLAIDGGDNFHVSYVDATLDDLIYLYVDAGSGAMTREIVDDGFKTELAVTGEEVPIFALLGEDSSIVLEGDIPGIVYQDATFLDLMYASRDAGVVTDPAASWVISVLIGNDPKFYMGAQGFYADQVPGRRRSRHLHMGHRRHPEPPLHRHDRPQPRLRRPLDFRTSPGRFTCPAP